MSREHTPLPQTHNHKIAPKWLSSLTVDKVISPVAYHVDLPLRYRWLHPVFHASKLKHHIGPVPDTKPPVVTNNKDIGSEYEVE